MPMWLHDYVNPLESGRYETWRIANPIQQNHHAQVLEENLTMDIE